MAHDVVSEIAQSTLKETAVTLEKAREAVQDANAYLRAVELRRMRRESAGRLKAAWGK